MRSTPEFTPALENEARTLLIQTLYIAVADTKAQQLQPEGSMPRHASSKLVAVLAEIGGRNLGLQESRLGLTTPLRAPRYTPSVFFT